MAATETLLQGATEIIRHVNASYTAGAGTLVIDSAVTDHGGSAVAPPYEILVGRNRPAAERRFFLVSAGAGTSLTIVASPGYTDDQNYVAGDQVDLISAWETQRRLRAFATLHAHTGGVDGSALDTAALGSGTLTAARFATAPGILTPAMIANQSANVGLFGPASGGAAAPSMRAIVAADLPAITTWTPGTITQAASTPAFTLVQAKVWQAGKLATFWCTVVFTGAGTAGSTIFFNLPAGLTLASATNFPCIGSFIYVDQGTASYVGGVQVQTTTQIAFIAHNNNGGIGALPNFAIANTDTLSFVCTAELA